MKKEMLRECKAMHEEDFWSSWLREVKKKEWQKLRRMKKKRVKRGKEKRRKKRTTRRQSKRRCEGCVSVEAFEIFGQG